MRACHVIVLAECRCQSDLTHDDITQLSNRQLSFVGNIVANPQCLKGEGSELSRIFREENRSQAWEAYPLDASAKRGRSNQRIMEHAASLSGFANVEVRVARRKRRCAATASIASGELAAAAISRARAASRSDSRTVMIRHMCVALASRPYGCAQGVNARTPG